MFYFYPMCRYSFNTYKHHYVCFDCRKIFKQYPTEDLIMRDGLWDSYKQAYLSRIPRKAEEFRDRNPKLVAVLDGYFNRRYPCPQCRQDMHNIGRDFRAPAQHKIKEWEIIRSIYRTGHAFQTCGCNGPGFIPRKPEEHLEYLRDMEAYYRVRIAQRQTKTPAELAEYLAYWQQKIEKVQAELRKLGH